MSADDDLSGMLMRMSLSGSMMQHKQIQLAGFNWSR